MRDAACSVGVVGSICIDHLCKPAAIQIPFRRISLFITLSSKSDDATWPMMQGFSKQHQMKNIYDAQSDTDKTELNSELQAYWLCKGDQTTQSDCP